MSETQLFHLPHAIAMERAREALVKIAARSNEDDIIRLAIRALEDICELLGDKP